VLTRWEKGILGKAEFVSLLLETVNPEDLEGFLNCVSPEILNWVKDEVGKAPETPGEWSQAISIWKDDEEATRRYRRGVEALRAWFARSP
jgi:hypothetical protein